MSQLFFFLPFNSHFIMVSGGGMHGMTDFVRHFLGPEVRIGKKGSEVKA